MIFSNIYIFTFLYEKIDNVFVFFNFLYEIIDNLGIKNTFILLFCHQSITFNPF